MSGAEYSFISQLKTNQLEKNCLFQGFILVEFSFNHEDCILLLVGLSYLFYLLLLDYFVCLWIVAKKSLSLCVGFILVEMVKAPHVPLFI